MLNYDSLKIKNSEPRIHDCFSVCVLLVALERKISMRQSREELIKRGVLKEMYDKGKGTGLLSTSQAAVRAVRAHSPQAWETVPASFYRLCAVKPPDRSGEGRGRSRQHQAARLHPVGGGSALVLSLGFKPQDAETPDWLWE